MKRSNWKGIPTKEAMHFPEKGGRKYGQKIWEQDIRWNVSNLMEFLFPRERMPIFHNMAVQYVEYLLQKGNNTEEDKYDFCRQKGLSVNSLRKHIIPKLYRFGLIHRTRELPRTGKYTIKSKRRGYEKESLVFSTMMRKMADEWEMMVKTARADRQRQEDKAENREKEIQRQEKLEWERYLREKGEYPTGA